MNTPVIVIGDLHIGARNNSSLFLDYMKSYFHNELFPLIKQNNIKHVIQLGDTLDKRKNIDFITSAFLIKEWFTWFDENDVMLFSLIGNHDTYYKNTNSVSGIKQYENLFKNIKIITDPTNILIGNTNFMCVPWVCPENKDNIKNYIHSPENRTGRFNIICGHFELAGFAIHKNFMSKSGTLENNDFDNIDHVFSGHYHSPSENGIIQYVGTPYWLTWNDYGDKKKVVLFDADDPLCTMTNVYTEKSLFHKFVYQSGMTVNDIDIPRGSYVKLIVNEPDDLLDVFVNDISDKFNLSQCQIIDMSENAEILDTELSDIELDDPFKILMNSISGIKNPIVANELLSIYKEAQTIMENL